jgi:cobalt/nickel transport system ATP-binding protein
VAIAGVVAMEPRVVLMDEPTSDLDPRGRRELQAILGRIAVTRLVSSHNLDFVLETCDRVVLLDEGRVCADGPVRSVLANEALMLEHGLEVPGSIPQAERDRAAAEDPFSLHGHDHSHDHHHEHTHHHP